MANRRRFLQGVAVLSSAPLAANTFARARRAPTLHSVVFDQRHGEARAFGALAASLGTRALAIEADITELWKRELLALWKTSARPVAGLTERPALFLLERLAWDHGLRVVFEAEHATAPEGLARHRVLRSGDAGLESELSAAAANWPAVLAAALLDGRSAAANFHPTDAAMAEHRGESLKLYSWIIAPRSALLV